MQAEPPITPSEKAVQYVVDAIPRPALFAFLSTLGDAAATVFKGFKIEARSVGMEAVRGRLCRHAARHEGWFLGLIEQPTAPWQPWRDCLPLFDEQWLRGNWRTLARGEDGRELIVALALDPRDSLRCRARRTLRRNAYWDRRPGSVTPVKPAAWEALAGLLVPEPAARPQTAASRKPTPAAGKRDTELRDEIDRLRKRLRKQQARLTAHERDATAERETWQAEKHELRRRLKAAESAKSSFEAQIATRVAEQVNAFRRSLTGLTPYIEHTRQALADVGGQPLLERVTALLAEHRRLNEGYASLSALRAELARLEAADEQLTACVEEAVIVLPETEPLRAELRRRRDELQRLIPDAVHLDAADELAGMLLGRVKAAVLEEAPAAALDDIERTVRLDVIRCLLGPEQTERILAAVQRRRTLLEQIRTDTEMAQAESPHLSAAAREPREIWNLTEELQGGTPAERVWLYVDGYNAIRRVASLARIEEQQGLARARDLFCSRCRAQAAKFAHFEIVFDGVGTLSERLTERALTVVFTAQVESSQNADMYLAERLRQARQKAPVIWLVTVDYGLRARVQDVCDAFITPLHFCRFLNS